ncbi:MAG: hypothetical protein AUJ52_11745 [Elusimicrobia bacterium CG1_02_63_36]|nr:MAG: hypothetical protein AUJ52_11745 [Elusimicrobia bacterium CG1_02_63_36]PIP82527.1 MAG: hypothetical protein COR54_14405 [Elusimicrobia bacterium CG22_combo_CG10-13_8_21_14_all_63_91]PJA15237.1 MAG: hypothetical protein COX66_10780 [Elusimicrobia bacterium CG_4_10_14_0_2_um_filter_63_34]PJB26503.1 MAG: hypothetical protein CO113_03015 [Elusimicrobia bacterium CG_4_9_14_3_um_filter_62_55]
MSVGKEKASLKFTLDLADKGQQSLYAREKFMCAVRRLAVGREKIKTRLFDAYVEIVAVSDSEIPDDLLEDFHWIRNSLTKKEPKRHGVILGRTWSEGRLNATLRGMRLHRAVEITERILYLAEKLQALAKSPK